MNVKSLIVVLALTVAGCATGVQQTDYTTSAAIAQMESFIKAHAALSNTTPGPMETQCQVLEKLDESEENEYACATFIKDQNLVLQADCSRDIGCEATGYKVWDEKTKQFVDPQVIESSKDEVEIHE